MADIHIINVDKICDYCGYHNKISITLSEGIDIVACGQCASFLMIPPDFPEEEKEKLAAILEKAIEETM